MKIIYFSSGIRGITCLKYLIKKKFHIITVIYVSDDMELVKLCRMFEIKMIKNDLPNTKIFSEKLKTLDADLFILSGYNKILKPIIFTIPPLGVINLHGGRLPQYRGAAPINWQIINGEKIGGCCILFVDTGIDTGPIIRQQLYSIESEDTHISILNKTLKIFPRLLGVTLEAIESGTALGIPQDPQEGCYYTRRCPIDSEINWFLKNDIQVHNLVRAMYGPYPSAFTFCSGIKIEINETQLLNEEIRGISGRISMKREDGVVVICRNRGLLLRKIKVVNKYLQPQKYFNILDILG